MFKEPNAFPSQIDHNELDKKGVTLRDYFAAKAMQGIMADPQAEGSFSDIAQRSYKIARAMLIARKD